VRAAHLKAKPVEGGFDRPRPRGQIFRGDARYRLSCRAGGTRRAWRPCSPPGSRRAASPIIHMGGDRFHQFGENHSPPEYPRIPRGAGSGCTATASVCGPPFCKARAGKGQGGRVHDDEFDTRSGRPMVNALGHRRAPVMGPEGSPVPPDQRHHIRYQQGAVL